MGLLLVVLAAGAVIVGIVREGPGDVPNDAPANSPDQPEVLTVYYFHGKTRCETCRAIESAAERVIRERFAEEVEAGTLRYEAVNYDLPVHRHFLQEYDLAFGSVVVQGVGGDRPWENLADVWTLVHDDKAELEAYLAERIASMLARSG